MKKLLLITISVSLLLMGCKESYQKDNNIAKDISSEEMTQDVVENIISKASNSYFPVEGEYTYDVKKFFLEDVSELTVKVSFVKKYDQGSIYQVSIQYNDIPERYYFSEDRYDIGLFFVTENTIYLITNYEDIPSEDIFITEGMIVYSSLGEEQNPTDYDMWIKYDNDKCECRFWNPLIESGYYCDMVWTKNEGLTYFQSGFGAEKDPIEIELKK